jgi:hypothetical protein
MDAFLRELKDTTQAQSSEIRGLKSVLMEAFAWAEETKSRAQQLNSPMYVCLWCILLFYSSKLDVFDSWLFRFLSI